MSAGALALVCAVALSVPAAAAEKPQPRASDPVAQAEDRVVAAEKDLDRALVTARRITIQADRAERQAEDARRDLGTYAREAYRSGGVDLMGLASLFDSPNPSDTMRRAMVVRLLTEHQDSQVADALAAVGRVDVLRDQAADLVKQARSQLKAAESALRTAKRKRDIMGELSKGAAAGVGTKQLTELCLASDVVVDVCAPPPWGEQNLTFDAVMIERYVHVRWPQIEVVGGWRPSDPYPDHPSGRAVDIMMPNGGSGEDVALGDEIARYYQENAAAYGIYYMIWRQRIWKAGEPVGQWTAMADRGSPTANHMDHVHISVTNGTSGNAWQLAEQRSADMAALIGKDRGTGRGAGSPSGR